MASPTTTANASTLATRMNSTMPAKPKRPLTAYNLFFRAERSRLLSLDHTDHTRDLVPASYVGNVTSQNNNQKKRRLHRRSHGKIGFQALTQQIAAGWRDLDPRDRAIYTEQAAEDRKRYFEELAAYKKVARASLEEMNKQDQKHQELESEARSESELQWLREAENQRRVVEAARIKKVVPVEKSADDGECDVDAGPPLFGNRSSIAKRNDALHSLGYQSKQANTPSRTLPVLPRENDRGFAGQLSFAGQLKPPSTMQTGQLNIGQLFPAQQNHPLLNQQLALNTYSFHSQGQHPMAMLDQTRNTFAGVPLRDQQARWHNPLVLMNLVQAYHSHQQPDVLQTQARTGQVNREPLDCKQPSLVAAADVCDFGEASQIIRPTASGPRASVADMAVDAVIQQHKAAASSLPPTNVASAGNVARSVSSGTSGSILKKPQMARPKRPLSAYNLFFRRERANLLGEEMSQEDAEYPAGPEKKRRRRHRKTHGKMGFQDMARYVAGRWKALDPAAKAEFEDRAAKNLQRYWKEMDVYKKEWEIYEERQKIQDLMTSDDRYVSIDNEIGLGRHQSQDSILHVPTVDPHMKLSPKTTSSSSKRKVKNKETNNGFSSHSPNTDALSPTTGGRVGASGLDLLTAVMEERY